MNINELENILKILELEIESNTNSNETDKIKRAINLIKEYKNIIQMDINKIYIGKWISFRQEGMESILHGKIIDYQRCIDYIGYYVVKCKKGKIKYVNVNNVLKFYDNKTECYNEK